MDHAGSVGGPARPRCWLISWCQSNSSKTSCDTCLVMCIHVNLCRHCYIAVSVEVFIIAKGLQCPIRKRSRRLNSDNNRLYSYLRTLKLQRNVLWSFRVTCDVENNVSLTRNVFCWTWYLPHSHVHNERTVPMIMSGCIAHARNGRISTSGLKSDVTVVFLDPYFLNDAIISAICVH